MPSAENLRSSHLLQGEAVSALHTHLSETEHQNANKGKGKERDIRDRSSSTSSEHVDTVMTYPPMTENVEETRHVEENLRRWEVAERQRRKAARASTQSSNSLSLVGDVSRRATSIWQGRKTMNLSITGGTLQSQENNDFVPLTGHNISLSPSPTNSDDTHISNPFSNPSEDLSSFSDTDSPVVQPTTNHHAAIEPGLLNKSRKLTSIAAISLPPPPQPLNLPPPRTPPPIAVPRFPETVNSELRDLGPKSAQELNFRWWHDWLCGCSEGPDRGGDYQAGRTNPFE